MFVSEGPEGTHLSGFSFIGGKSSVYGEDDGQRVGYRSKSTSLCGKKKVG